MSAEQGMKEGPVRDRPGAVLAIDLWEAHSIC